jgi:hypothetical protein
LINSVYMICISAFCEEFYYLNSTVCEFACLFTRFGNGAFLVCLEALFKVGYHIILALMEVFKLLLEQFMQFLHFINSFHDDDRLNLLTHAKAESVTYCFIIIISFY